MWSLGRRSVVAFVAFVACSMCTVGGASPARADDMQSARQAYDRGAAAYDAGDYALAASELARADELSASDVALELALKAAVKGDDPRTAMRLVLRADKRAHGGSLAAAATVARERMGARTGTITVTCPGRASCAATIDAGDVPVKEPTVVLAGVHRVTVQADASPREAFDARVEPGANVEVKASPAAVVARIGPPETPRASPSSTGLSATWFWVGVGVTAVLSGVAIGSAVDTRAKHDDFEAVPTTDRQQTGQDAQLRTNLLTGGAGLTALATAVVGLVLVRWSAPQSGQAGR